ncbi:MAG: hypothetical protein KAJ40_05850 [Alphaproteobacteria bacterium]|nr:hypothetical protein [Alphaproteobacteria bacterium]
MIENNRYFWSHLKTSSVTVRVRQKKKETGVIFRIGSMIDTGHGRQVVMLEHVDYPRIYHIRNKGGDVAIPFRMGDIDFIYTSLHKPELRNVNTLLSALYKKGEVEKIVPEVICPGDLLVFRQDRGSSKIKMVEALRVVEHHLQKPKMASYAL